MSGQNWHTADRAYTPDALFQGHDSRRPVVADEQPDETNRDPEQPTNDDEQLIQAALEQLKARSPSSYYSLGLFSELLMASGPCRQTATGQHDSLHYPRDPVSPR